MSFTFNQIQQVIDACAKFMKDPENFIINNHVHDVFSIRGLPEALDDKVSKDVFIFIQEIKRFISPMKNESVGME